MDALKRKLEEWAENPGRHAVQFITIDDVDDLARWAYQELKPNGRWGMTQAQQALDSANLRVGAAQSEIKMLKAALNLRDITIAQLKEKLK